MAVIRVTTSTDNAVRALIRWLVNGVAVPGADVSIDPVVEPGDISGTFNLGINPVSGSTLVASVSAWDAKGRRRTKASGAINLDTLTPVDPPDPGGGGGTPPPPPPSPGVTPTTNLSSLVRNGFTFTFSAARPVGYYISGFPFVQTPVQVDSIAPAFDAVTYTQSNGTPRRRNGAMFGFPADVRGSLSQGFSSDASGKYSSAMNIDPGNTGAPLIKAVGETGTIIKTEAYGASFPDDAWKRTKLVETLTLVDTIPPAGSFAPWPGDSDVTPPANVSQVNMALFKNLTPASAPPDYASMLALVDRIRVCWSTMDGSNMRKIRGAQQEDRYSLYSAADTGRAMLWCHTSTGTADEKKTIVTQICQIGLNNWAWIKNRDVAFFADGGHSQGIASSIIFAAIVLNKPEMLDVLLVNTERTGNDNLQYSFIGSDRVDKLPGITNTYNEESSRGRRIKYSSEHVGRPEWNVKGGGNQPFWSSSLMEPYRANCTYAMFGAWLAIDLLEYAPGYGNDPLAAVTYNDRMMAWMEPYYTGADSTYFMGMAPSTALGKNAQFPGPWIFEMKVLSESVISYRTFWTGPPDCYCTEGDDGLSVTPTAGGFNVKLPKGKVWGRGSTGKTAEIRYSTTRPGWTGANSGNRYQGTEPWVDGSWTIVTGIDLNSATFVPVANGTYYVQFRLVDSRGNGVWSNNEPRGRIGDQGDFLVPQVVTKPNSVPRGKVVVV